MRIRLSLIFCFTPLCAIGLFSSRCSIPAHDGNFQKNQENIEQGELVGPFTGVIKDSAGNFLPDVNLVLTWQVAPSDSSNAVPEKKSITVLVTTSVQGAYSIPNLIPEKGTKVTAFRLLAYKFGFIGYRSDVRFNDHGLAQDFVQENNLIVLKKAEATLNHSDHLSFLMCNPTCEEPMKTIFSKEIAEAEREKIPTSSEPTIEPEPSNPSLTELPQSTPEATNHPFIDAREVLASALLELNGSPSHTPIDLTDLFETLPFPDAVRQKEAGPSYAGVHFKSTVEDPASKGRYDIAIRLWRTETTGEADALFSELQSILGIGKIQKNKQTIVGQVYDRTIRIHGIIIKLKRERIVVQVSCGDRVCANTATIKKLVEILRKRILI